MAAYGANTFNDNTTDESGIAPASIKAPSNFPTVTSLFEKSGSNTFANRYSYFEPVDIPELRGVAVPTGSRLDIGAVQSEASGGGPPIPALAQLIDGGLIS